MTAIAETSAVHATDSWIETDAHLAGNIAAGLHNFAATVIAYPEIAPLVRTMLAGLMAVVSATDNPHAAMSALVHAASTHGGVASKSKFGGVDIDYGPAVRIWVVTGWPTEPEPAVVTVVPEPPVDETAESEPVEADVEPVVEVSAA